MLLFYLLLRRAPPERALVGFFRTFGLRRRAYRAVREAEADLSRYIGTITLVNLCLGALLAVSFHLVGLPNAGVLGATIAVLNYVPLLGALASFVLTLVAGLANFDSFGLAIVPPLIAAAFHTVETNFVTPAILGKRLTLDPFLVVISLLFGAWLWGIGGAVLAVPLLLFSVAAWRGYICYGADRKREQALAGAPPAALGSPAAAPGE